MRVLSIVGNRPQFVKSGPVSVALREAGIEEVVLHTGQHYDHELSGVFFEELGLDSPRYALDAGGGSHGEQLARMLPGIERVVLDERPDWVLVYGDTNSTLAGALAAAKARFAVAHVEAGLRSFDRSMPEELNRVLTDRLASLLLCPTELAAANLAHEGLSNGVHVIGDVMLDAMRILAGAAAGRSDALERAGVEAGGYVLLTLHREANVRAEALAQIVSGVALIAGPVVFPAHPRTVAALAAHRIALPEQVRVLAPAGYLDFAALVAGARTVLTDSGGVQKEAYWHGVPCVTLRDSTEWPETVETGWNVLVGDDPAAIAAAAGAPRPTSHRPALYGDGHAAEAVARLLATIPPL